MGGERARFGVQLPQTLLLSLLQGGLSFLKGVVLVWGFFPIYFCTWFPGFIFIVVLKGCLEALWHGGRARSRGLSGFISMGMNLEQNPSAVRLPASAHWFPVLPAKGFE